MIGAYLVRSMMIDYNLRATELNPSFNCDIAHSKEQ